MKMRTAIKVKLGVAVFALLTNVTAAHVSGDLLTKGIYYTLAIGASIWAWSLFDKLIED